MKNFALALALCCIAAGSVQAQKMTPGIKGGFNFSDISNFNGDNRLSGHVGLFLHSRLNAKWSVQPEILYSGQGQQYIIPAVNVERTVALSYIQVPIMFQYYPVRQLYLEFGPQIGFLLSANDKGSGGKVEVDDSYKKTDIGLAFGVGIRATQMLGFYARYNAGLTDISKDRVDHFNRVAQLGVAIRLK